MGVSERTTYERALASTIEEARLDLGWSQQMLAERATAHLDGGELTQTTLSRMLRGAVPMRMDYIAAIAHAFGMSLSALCRLAEGREPKPARALPVTPEGDSSPSGARRRRPRPVSGPRQGA